MSETNNKNKKRVFFWKGEQVAEIRLDSLFTPPNCLSGFVWDNYKDVEV